LFLSDTKNNYSIATTNKHGFIMYEDFVKIGLLENKNHPRGQMVVVRKQLGIRGYFFPSVPSKKFNYSY
jgi:hypothetical protein